jgi:hypothetical protein
MHELRTLDSAAYERARREPLRVPARPWPGQVAPYFAYYVCQVLEGPSIYGSRVGTTLDLPLKRFAQNAVARGIDRLESGFPWIRHRDPRLLGCRDPSPCRRLGRLR